MKAVFVFIDGLGLGADDTAVNPCASPTIGLLRCFENGESVTEARGGGLRIAVEACLGVEGLPQSATGQTALFTGVNAAALLGRHLPGYPNEMLRNVLREASILKCVTERGFSARFVNAYRPLFFRLKETMKWRLSATTVVTLAANLPFFDLDDLTAGKCLYHDFTNEALIRRGIGVPPFTPEEAGGILAGMTATHEFLLYEYFLTDKAGHGQDGDAALALMHQLDRFVSALTAGVCLDDTLVLIASDHGNIEDLSVKTHTRNRIPLFAWGCGKERLAERVHVLTDIAPALLSLFDDGMSAAAPRDEA